MDENAIIYSKEAEESIIGATIGDPVCFSELDIEPDDFYVSKNKTIWQTFIDLHRSGNTLDLVTIIDKLNRDQSENWVLYLSECINDLPSWADARNYAGIIKDKATRRRMVQIASRIATTAHDPKSEIDKSLPGFIDQLSDTTKIQNGAVPLKNYLSMLYDDVEHKAENPAEIWGLETGFKQFDQITGGLQQGESMIMSGVPGVGKSIFAMQLGVNLGKSSPGAIYSMEMGAMQTTRRIVSGYGKIPTRQLKTGKLDEWDGFISCIQELSLLPIFLSDSAGWTTTTLRADLSRLKAQHGIKWFVLDYLYLLNDGGADEIERTSLASKGLKRICKDLNLAAIIIHSMNKAGMASERPDQSDLRGSGQAVYDADLITFLTKFSPLTKQEEKIKPPDRENLRTLWFGKGRELENPRRYIHFTKFQGYPAFAEAEMEAGNEREQYWNK